LTLGWALLRQILIAMLIGVLVADALERHRPEGGAICGRDEREVVLDVKVFASPGLDGPARGGAVLVLDGSTP
jgi:hypothetical protein